MIPKIFEIDGDKLIINEEILSIPELSILLQKYPKDYINIFKYIYHLTKLDGAYSEFAEEEREEILKKDYGKNIKMNDADIVNAIQKVKKLYNSMQLYRAITSAKRVLDNLILSSQAQEISFGKEGNYANLFNFATNIEKSMESLNNLEKMYIELIKQVRIKGNKKLSYDQKK